MFMRTLAPALLIILAALATGETTAAADPAPGLQCHEGFCDDGPTINLFPSGSAQLPSASLDTTTPEAGRA